MKTVKLFSAAAVLSAAFASFSAHAGVTTDAHGNVGYDTAEECDAAVLAGTAKFYQTFTHKSPLIRVGEKSVTTAKLSDLGEEYARGACDLGVGRKLGRDGVSTPLQGKYVPFSPDMPINVYLNAEGKATRVSMAQCDNWFSGDAPRAVVIPAPVAKEEATPVVDAAPAVIAAPVVAKSFGVRPYAFGTVGALHEKVQVVDGLTPFSDKDTKLAGQVGLGAQFNKYLGAEAFYQAGAKHKYQDKVAIQRVIDAAAANGTTVDVAQLTAEETSRVKNQTYGARLTAGTNVSDNFRVFAKAGAARVEHKVKNDFNATSYKDKRTVPTAGLGATYNFNDNLSFRADYDHFFKQKEKNGMKWKGAHYLGAGVQYKF